MENLITLLFVGMRVSMAILLYIFLGWAMLILLRSLKQEGLRIKAQIIPAITLKFASELFPDQEIKSPQFTIGRSTACECVVDHETISSRHATLAYHHSQWWLEDAGSKNGSFINEQRVLEPTVITTHDILRCGKIEFTVEFERP